MLALLSAIPYVSSLNCCCCLWILGGGFLAAYLFRSENKAISTGQAAWVGILSGIWGAFVYSFLSAILWKVMSAQFISQFNEIMKASDTEIPSEAMNMILDFTASPVIAFLVVFAGSLFFFPLMTLIGSLIGAAIFKTKKTGL